MSSTETIYVWRAGGEPGLYNFCTDRNHSEFRNPDWSFLGELSAVAELADLPARLRSTTIPERIAGGWPMEVRRVGPGAYFY